MKHIFKILILFCLVSTAQTDIGARMLLVSRAQYANEGGGASLDYTNFLDNEIATEADFTFTNRAGTVDTGISSTSVNGEWCYTTTTTPSGNTGASAPPIGRSGFIYTEGSGNQVSTVWAMRRNTSLDNSSQDVFLDLKYNLYGLVSTNVFIEYATIASPNETTDWTILETIPGTLVDLWEDDTFDFSGASATSTLWLRIRISSTNNSKTDVSFSTWREYQ